MLGKRGVTDAMEKSYEHLLIRNNALQRVNDQVLNEKLTMKKLSQSAYGQDQDLGEGSRRKRYQIPDKA